MLALGMRYLTKYAVATDVARQRAEWPPHEGRVFMAMAAAHFETGADALERTALEWLESAPSPALCASEADERSLVRAYVPVNDAHGGIQSRPRQDRAFPRTRPRDEHVYLIWSAEPAAEIRTGLERVCGKVTRVGHSMSAVQMWVVPPGEEPEPNWIPAAATPETHMRVSSSGTLQALEAAFNGAAIEEYDRLAEQMDDSSGKKKAQLKAAMKQQFPAGRPESRRPQLMRWEAYGRPEADASEEIAEGPFDENFVVLAKREGPNLGLETTLQLTTALRNCAIKKAAACPEWLTGHDTEGRPSTHPHAAFFPLPFVGSEHADGHILGLGIALPRNLNPDEVRRALGSFFFDVNSGEERDIAVWNCAWRWTLEREKRERPPLALHRDRWTEPSRTWASVTPVVLHHYPKKRDGDVERIVRDAFVSALLPEPDEIEVRSVSVFAGAGHAKGIPGYAEGGAELCRYQTHVRVVFGQKVRGPILVGRGRFRGYGLFLPVHEKGSK